MQSVTEELSAENEKPTSTKRGQIPDIVALRGRGKIQNGRDTRVLLGALLQQAAEGGALPHALGRRHRLQAGKCHTIIL